MSLTHRFEQTLATFIGCLPAVREGDAEAIHDARVATRRLRATVPLLAVVLPSPDWEMVKESVRGAGRALGRARDLDVSLSVAAELEARAPLFAPVLASLRTTLEARRLRARRKLIKRLEALALDAPMLPQSANAGRAPRLPDANAVLAAALSEQAIVVGRAVEHATGVYFVKRAHRARIEIKKLRYLLEMSDGCEAQCKGLKLLKASQQALGQIHDREVLRDHLAPMEFASGTSRALADALVGVLEAEIRGLYQTFVARRTDLYLLCDAVQAWARAVRVGTARRRMLSIGAVALPSAGVILLARRIAK